MYLLIIILPLLSSIASGLLGRKIGVTGSHIISCVCLGISSTLIATAFYEVCLCNSPVYVNLGYWIESELLTISWEFIFDQLTVSLALAVLFCSTLIHIYSIYYLPSDPHNQRFFSYLSAFTFGMLVLVCGANFFVMFAGWAQPYCKYLRSSVDRRYLTFKLSLCTVIFPLECVVRST